MLLRQAQRWLEGKMKILNGTALAVAAAVAVQLCVASDSVLAQPAPMFSDEMPPPARWLGTTSGPTRALHGQAAAALGNAPYLGPRHDHLDPATDPLTSSKHWWHPRRDMFQLHTYFPEAHGYYSMIPYHFKHIAFHQEFARRWGGDPRNPYSNEVFEQLEEEEEPDELEED